MPPVEFEGVARRLAGTNRQPTVPQPTRAIPSRMSEEKAKNILVGGEGEKWNSRCDEIVRINPWDEYGLAKSQERESPKPGGFERRI
ncbi:hypothetical protein SUGI_0658640 [Cryptomeria japonica]|nr:hypothetical protein SUGI_0658640 [Cryptomeria japonica]